MHWTLWTMLIAIILIAIEFLVIKCFEVENRRDEWNNIYLPVWNYLLVVLLAFVPVGNLITVVVFPVVIGCYIDEDYYDCRLKDVKKDENKNNLMLHILTILTREV